MNQTDKEPERHMVKVSIGEFFGKKTEDRSLTLTSFIHQGPGELIKKQVFKALNQNEMSETVTEAKNFS